MEMRKKIVVRRNDSAILFVVPMSSLVAEQWYWWMNTINLCCRLWVILFIEYRVDANNPLPLIYQRGQLIIKDYDKEFQLYRLAFPNEEVRYGFLNFWVPYYTPVNEDENFYIGKFVQEQRVGKVPEPDKKKFDCVNNSSIGLRLFYLKLLFNINTSNVFNSINWCLSEILLIFFAEVIHIFHSDFLWDFVYAIFSTL